jgi:hypothetical protein
MTRAFRARDLGGIRWTGNNNVAPRRVPREGDGGRNIGTRSSDAWFERTRASFPARTLDRAKKADRPVLGALLLGRDPYPLINTRD